MIGGDLTGLLILVVCVVAFVTCLWVVLTLVGFVMLLVFGLLDLSLLVLLCVRVLYVC